MEFWLVDKAGGRAVANPRLAIGENNEFRIWIVDVNVSDPPFYFDGKVAQSRALQSQQHFPARSLQNQCEIDLFILVEKLTFLIQTMRISFLFTTRSWLPRSWLPDPGFQILAARSWLADPGHQILATWSYLELSGAIWSYLELSRTIQGYLDLPVAIWNCLELYGAIWSYLELSEAIWRVGPAEPRSRHVRGWWIGCLLSDSALDAFLSGILIQALLPDSGNDVLLPMLKNHSFGVSRWDHFGTINLATTLYVMLVCSFLGLYKKLAKPRKWNTFALSKMVLGIFVLQFYFIQWYGQWGKNLQNN